MAPVSDCGDGAVHNQTRDFDRVFVHESDLGRALGQWRSPALGCDQSSVQSSSDYLDCFLVMFYGFCHGKSP